jgi:LysM repeat protein
MKIKYLLTLALSFTVAFTLMACGTTQKKDKQEHTDEMEELWEDEEFDGEDFGDEGGEFSDEEFEGEVALNGDPNKADHIVVSKESMTLNLYDSDGGLIFSFPVAVGKHLGNKQKRGDMKTPEGEFKVTEIVDASTWVHDFGDGKGEIAGCYGNWFIRLGTHPHEGIGIHGTHLPESIGTRATEGCIRLNNADLDKLKPLVKAGMKVTIEASVKDMEADGRIEENGVNKSTFADENTDDDIFADLENNKTELNSVDPSKVVKTESAAVDHVIVEGDTFASLAKEYNTTSERIQELNPGLDPRRIQIGQTVRVKGSKPYMKEEQKAEPKPEASVAVVAGDEVYHTIESGDTFGHLAVKYDTSSKKIQELNPDLDPTRLQLGQKIRVK